MAGLEVEHSAGRSLLRAASLYRKRRTWLRIDVLLCTVLYVVAAAVWVTGGGSPVFATTDAPGIDEAISVGDGGVFSYGSRIGDVGAAGSDGDHLSSTSAPPSTATPASDDTRTEAGSSPRVEPSSTPVSGQDTPREQPRRDMSLDDMSAGVDGSAQASTDEAEPPSAENGVDVGELVDNEAASSPDAPMMWSDVGLYLLPAVALLQAVLYLSTFWSVDFECWLAFQPASSLSSATFVKASPHPHCGSQAMCRLVTVVHTDSTPVAAPARDIPHVFADMPAVWFEFQRTTFRIDAAPSGGAHVAKLLDSPTQELLSTYVRWKGHGSDTLGLAKSKWGLNEFNIPVPRFLDLFKEHATAPFFVFQVFCVLLWMLDENWIYSLFTLAMLVVFECLLVQQRIRNLRTLRGMKKPPQPVLVYRNKMWKRISSENLVPGDIVNVVRSPEIVKTITYPLPRNAPPNAVPRTMDKLVQCTAPCDILLLGGSCVANEAMLTGESVPQLKEAIRVDESTRTSHLEIDDGSSRRHAGNVVFGGTRVLLATPPSKDALAAIGIPPPKARGSIGVVVRTGFSTSQGHLMRTILFSTERVGVGNKQAFAFIGVLLVFAIAAAGYVLMEGLEDPTRSRYTLFLHCTLIITSVVPPELPMELSLAITTSLTALINVGIFCTEPYRIPSAGNVDVCCFDKTGTITSDRLVVRGVAGVEADPQHRPREGAGGGSGKHRTMGGVPLIAPTTVPEATLQVLAGCHSLVHVGSEVAGDPMEKAALAAVGWTPAEPDVVRPGRDGLSYAKNNGRDRYRVVVRHPFDSALKRMTTIISSTHLPRGPMTIVTKGAPEVVEGLLAVVPDAYRPTYRQLSFNGGRVLALARRALPTTTDVMEARNWPRDAVERDLEFAGFLVLDCPMKPDSRRVLKELRESKHRLVMITGDNPLTAVDVAKKVGIMTTTHRTLVLMVDTPPASTAHPTTADLYWNDLSAPEADRRDIRVPFDVAGVAEVLSGSQVAVTGAAIGTLLDAAAGDDGANSAVDSIANSAAVFARMSPRNKEILVARMNSLGRTTLMCGDGTNDVGALTQAHIGVSIINSPEMEEKLRRRQQHAKRQALPSNLTWAQKLQELENRVQKEAQSTLIQFGDASIAAPFTSKRPTISSTSAIVRQGRCTLVTTIQMYRILAVHCLVLSYMLSAMYSSGVKSGDTQSTFAGLAVAGFFFVLSRSQPLETLAATRPPSSVFCASALLSVGGQFAVHLACLIYCVRMCEPFQEENIDPDGDFSPNVINSAVFLLSNAMQASTFLVNYQGAPFMTTLRDHTALWRGLLATYAVLFLAATEVMLDFNEMLELVPMPNEQVKWTLVGLMAIDTIAVWVWEKIVRAVVG